MGENLNLTREEFNDLVRKLMDGDESLFEISFKSLVLDGIQSLKKKYYNANSQLVEDAAIETLLLFRKKIKSGKIKYGGLKSLYNLMLYQEFIRMKKKEDKIVLFYEYEKEDDDKDALDEERQRNEVKAETIKMLTISFDKLEKECRKMLTYVYYKKYRLKKISNIYNVSEEVARKRKQRCLDKLRVVLSKNLNN